jgi:TIGR03009 family protein
MVPRSNLFALAGLLLSAMVGVAQQPTTPPPPLPDQSKLLGHMQSWEKAMADVKTLVLECKRDDKKVTFGTTDYFEGKAFFMKDKDDIFILIQMVKMDKKDPKKPKPDASGIYERYVCNPTACYEYVPQEKKIRFRQIPTGKGAKGGDDNLLSFLFNTNAKQAMERYKLKLVKEDKDFVYVEVSPTRAADKVDFEMARVCLDKETYLPRQLWFRQNNGDEVLWDLPTVTKNAKLERKIFEKPEFPGKDWKYEEMPKEPEPRIVRPKGDK